MKILVVNIKYLGDLIVSSPGIRSLRKTYPESEIVLLLRKGYEFVFKNNPNVNRIITFNPELKGNSSLKKIFDGIRFIKELRSEKFDSVIVLHPGDRTAFWAWFSGAKKRIAPRKQKFSFLFNELVDVEENLISYLEYYNKIVFEAGAKIDSNRTELFISAEEEKWSDDFLNSHKIAVDDILIGVHPSARESSRIWKAENFVRLINKFLKNSNIRIIVFEGPQDKEICSEIKNSFNEQMKIFFVNTDILKAASLIKKCQLFISHDTGTRHIAVAMLTPVIALIPEDCEKCWNFYQETSNHFTIFGKRNFSQIENNGEPFLDGISVEEVYKRAGELLKLW